MNNKQFGQFYTNKNIFKYEAFLSWYEGIPKEFKNCILEPFAGNNNIIDMLKSLKLVESFKSYDIAPAHPEVEVRDTLLDFPQNHSLIVTNPPFLAKNVASRLNINVSIHPYFDLYEVALAKCLENAPFVAAVVPESFIVSEFFKDRLHSVISLTEKRIFKHTEHPVCLALFSDDVKKLPNYTLHRNNKLLGSLQDLTQQHLAYTQDNKIQVLPNNYSAQWHNPEGQIGLIAIDATDRNKKIRFVMGSEIDNNDVDAYCRLRTKIMISNHKNKPIKQIQSQKLVNKLNTQLRHYRASTHDVFLTAFKGLRDDGLYRRRLDFSTARQLLSHTLLALDK